MGILATKQAHVTVHRVGDGQCGNMESETGLAPSADSNHRKSLPEPALLNRHCQKGRFPSLHNHYGAIGACVGV